MKTDGLETPRTSHSIYIYVDYDLLALIVKLRFCNVFFDSKPKVEPGKCVARPASIGPEPTALFASARKYQFEYVALKLSLSTLLYLPVPESNSLST